MCHPKFKDQFINDEIAMIKYITLLRSDDVRVRRYAYQKLRDAAHEAQSESSENRCVPSSHSKKV